MLKSPALRGAFFIDGMHYLCFATRYFFRHGYHTGGWQTGVSPECLKKIRVAT